MEKRKSRHNGITMKQAFYGSEHQIQQAILDYLPYFGVKAFRVNSGLIPQEYNGRRRMIRMAPAGTPDIVGCRKSDGKMVCIEVKKPGNKPTDIQVRVMDEWREYGALVFVATSVEDVQNQLKKEAYG